MFIPSESSACTAFWGFRTLLICAAAVQHRERSSPNSLQLVSGGGVCGPFPKARSHLCIQYQGAMFAPLNMACHVFCAQIQTSEFQARWSVCQTGIDSYCNLGVQEPSRSRIPASKIRPDPARNSWSARL